MRRATPSPNAGRNPLPDRISSETSVLSARSRANCASTSPANAGSKTRALISKLSQKLRMSTLAEPITDQRPSITMSFTYYTRATRRNSLLHRTHDMLRRLGWVPPAVDRFPLFDAATLAAGGLYIGSKRLALRLAGASVDSDAAPYAKVGDS